AAGVDLPRGHADDAAGAVVDDRAGDVDALHELRASGACVVGERLVQPHAGLGEPVGGVAVDLRPGQVDRVAAADDAQTLVAHPAVLGAHRHAHPDQLGDGAGRQPVAAHLV